MSACECLTVCGWVLCNYLPWLGFLFWVHSEKFHTEIVCTDKIEVESFWLLIYLPMRSVWWKSPGSAHNHTQSQAITHRVTPAHLHTHYTVSLSCTLAHLHTRPAFPNRPCEVSLPTRSAFLCKLCCYHHLRTCHSLALQNFFLFSFFFSFIFCSSYYTYLVMHCCSQLALRVESSAMRSW